MFEHLSEDRLRVNVKDFGAVGDGVADDTAAICAAADSLADGGIVYIPAGIYSVGFIPFREGVTYLLEGKPEDTAAGFTDELRARIESGKEFAVLRSQGRGDIFMNHDQGEFASDHAASNYGLSGGVVDGVGRCRQFIFIHCRNVLLENCIILDSPNNHSIQVTGADDVMIRNCMFAGYNFTGNLYAETIQIEDSHPGAIGWHMHCTSNVSFGEYRFCHNVTVEDCYFGRSDKFGPPLIPIGHHGQGHKATVTGCYIRRNVFDNPLMMALRPRAYSELYIEDNTFISTEPKVIDTEEDAMIRFVTGKPEKKGVWVDPQGHVIIGIYEQGYSSEGNLHSVISRNKFILKGDRIRRALNAVGIYRPGMKASVGMVKIDEFGGKPYNFTGYRNTKQLISDLEFTDNEITVLDRRPSATDYLLRLEMVWGIKLSGNKINSPVENYSCWFRDNEAVALINSGYGNDARSRYIEAIPSRAVYLPLAEGQLSLYSGSGTKGIYLYTDDRGEILTDMADGGCAQVSVIPAEGYRFAGWVSEDGDFSPEGAELRFTSTLSLTAKYERT